jgi:hypothetical protein
VIQNKSLGHITGTQVRTTAIVTSHVFLRRMRSSIHSSGSGT